MKQGFWITGTDTGVGKTLVTCALMRAFSRQGQTVLGMKPVAAGTEWVNGRACNEDVVQFQAHATVSAPLAWINPYCFTQPIAPHLAAANEKRTIDVAHVEACFLQLSALAEVVLVEGAGGFCVPLDATAGMDTLAQRLALPVILVVGLRLGCLNHALLTAEAIKNRGLTLAGWVANQIDPEMAYPLENCHTLVQRLHAPLIGSIAFEPDPDPVKMGGLLSIAELVIQKNPTSPVT